MFDHYHTAIQSTRQWRHFFKPQSFRTVHRLDSVNDLAKIADDYGLFLLDRDCTLQGYHAKSRPPEFEDILNKIAPKSEIISNSSFDEVKKIRDIYGDLMPISKLVRFKGQGDTPYLLRFEPKMKIFRYEPPNLIDVTRACESEIQCGHIISYSYKKPDPQTVLSVIDMNRQIGRLEGKALMVGDRYMTDILAGNLAGIDTAKVRPYKPFSDGLDLIALRYIFDTPVGALMSRI